MQAAIDSAKRRFDLNISEEIHRIKKDMDLQTHGYPAFWLSIKKDFSRSNINYKLKCPMNYLYNLKLNKFRSPDTTIPTSYFFKKFPNTVNKKTCKRVEEMIVRYSLSLYEYNSSTDEDENNDYLILRTDFDDIIFEISHMNISGNYIGLFSWLIDRAFKITVDVDRNMQLKSKLNKNRSLLIKILYSVNPKNLLKCFSNNC